MMPATLSHLPFCLVLVLFSMVMNGSQFTEEFNSSAVVSLLRKHAGAHTFVTPLRTLSV